ncbi:hypothetical protein CsSME_00021534 [Camellia sinensis var. sinensis]
MSNRIQSCYLPKSDESAPYYPLIRPLKIFSSGTRNEKKNYFQHNLTMIGDGSDFAKMVNRELMGVIESLQHQNKKTEDNESSEETDCTCEKSDVVSGDAELCNVNSDILEEDDGKKGNQNSPSKSNHSKLTSERKLEVTDAVNDVDISSVKHEMSSNKKIKETAVDNKFNRTYKRKKPNDGICSTNLDSEVNRIQKAKQQ